MEVSDLSDRNARAASLPPQSLGTGRRHRQQKFVIVTAGQACDQPIRPGRPSSVRQRHLLGNTPADSPLARQIWPRS